MRVLLMADIHANLEALQACLAVTNNRQVDRVNVLGDLVGYGADPDACVAVTKGFDCIKGNHDAAMGDDAVLADFHDLAKQALLWTRQELTTDHAAFLHALPYHRVYAAEDYTISHGTLTDPFAYLESAHQFRENVKAMTTRLLFVAHTHIPAWWEIEEVPPQNARRTWKLRGHDLSYGKAIPLEPGYQHIIDVGSIGQPRDDDPRSCCVLYDSQAFTIEFLRFDYPREVTVSKMKAANLPPLLYQRLLVGQ